MNIFTQKLDKHRFTLYYLLLLGFTIIVPMIVFITLPIVLILTNQRLNDLNISKWYMLLMPIPVIGMGFAIYLMITDAPQQ